MIILETFNQTDSRVYNLTGINGPEMIHFQFNFFLNRKPAFKGTVRKPTFNGTVRKQTSKRTVRNPAFKGIVRKPAFKGTVRKSCLMGL